MTPTSIDPGAIYTVGEVCRLTRTGETKLRNAIRSGALIARKTGQRGTLIRGCDLLSWYTGLPLASDATATALGEGMAR